MKGLSKITIVFLFLALLCLLAGTGTQADTLNVTKVQWVLSSRVDMSTLEPAGQQFSKNNTLFVIRGLYPDFAYTPGKYSDDTKEAFIAYDGKQIKPSVYQVILGCPTGIVNWVQGTNKTVPIERAIFGGWKPGMLEDLYVCRAWFEDQWVIPGSYSYEDGVCSFPLHTEYKSERFEILVLNWYGELIDAGTGQFSDGSKY